MNEWLQSMRAAARAEVGAPDAGEVEDSRVDEILVSFFSESPETAGFTAALEALAGDTSWRGAPAGGAAATAQGVAADRTPSDVLDALGVPRRRARDAIAQSLDLNPDAADLLLDRPVAVLLTFDPHRVRRLADICDSVPGQIFAQIVSSSRGSSGYVYAYRPGVPPTEPAKRVGDPSSALPLLDWGYRFFGLRHHAG